MKIAMISYWMCPLTKLGVWKAGGMNVYILNLANQLGRLGHRVDIYTHTHRHSDESITQLHKNVQIIHLHKMENDIYTGASNFSYALYSFMKREKRKYDIFHAHYFLSGIVCIELAKKMKLSFVTTFHSLGIMKKKFSPDDVTIRIRWEKKIMQQSDAIISSSTSEKDDMDHYHKNVKKIYIVPPGVNHKIFRHHDQYASRKKLHLPTHTPILLFVGRIDPIKGLEVLIKSIALLKQKDNPYFDRLRLVIIGGDIKNSSFWKQEEVIDLQKLIRKNKLESIVQFIGSQPHHVLAFYYSAATVVVVPSSYETFGLVALEAMACGASVVASHAGGLGYLIKDTINGRLVKKQNFLLLSEVLEELLLNQNEREKIGRNAILESKNYCWDKQAYKVAQIYTKTLLKKKI